MAVQRMYSRFIPCLIVFTGLLVQDVFAEQIEASSKFPVPTSEETTTTSATGTMDDTVMDMVTKAVKDRKRFMTTPYEQIEEISIFQPPFMIPQDHFETTSSGPEKYTTDPKTTTKEIGMSPTGETEKHVTDPKTTTKETGMKPTGEPEKCTTDPKTTTKEIGGDINKSTIATHTRLSPSPPPIDNRTVGYQSMRRLLGDVLTGYDRRFRPRSDQSRFVFVQSTFVPQKIIDFDTPRNNFTIMGYFKMQWRDDFLRWTPGHYDDVKQVRIPSRDIWLPDLTIIKSQSGTAKVGSNNTDVVVLYSSGYIQWWPEGIYSVVCEISIKYFPMDEHVCTLSYFVAGEDTTTVKLVLFDDIITSEISENAEWDIRSVTSGVLIHKSSYVGSFHFTIKRRAGFAMYTLLVPAFLMSALCCMAFLVPVESGEKGSIAINVFLACLIYVTIITQTVPRNSADMSYFVVFVVLLLGLSVLLTFYTIAQSFLYQCRNRNACRCMAAITSVLRQHQLRYRIDIVAFVVSVVFVTGTMSSLLLLLQ